MGAVGGVLVGLLGEHIGDTVEVLLLAEGQLDRCEARAERSGQVGDDVLEVGAVLVFAGDEDQTRQVALDALPPGDVGADLDAVGDQRQAL